MGEVDSLIEKVTKATINKILAAADLKEAQRKLNESRENFDKTSKEQASTENELRAFLKENPDKRGEIDGNTSNNQ